jgi:isopenicillin N synthase-like dioxygenase
MIDSVFECGKEFVVLSFEEKMDTYINNIPNYRGYTPLGGSESPGPDGQGSNS